MYNKIWVCLDASLKPFCVSSRNCSRDDIHELNLQQWFGFTKNNTFVISGLCKTSRSNTTLPYTFKRADSWLKTKAEESTNSIQFFWKSFLGSTKLNAIWPSRRQRLATHCTFVFGWLYPIVIFTVCEIHRGCWYQIMWYRMWYFVVQKAFVDLKWETGIHASGDNVLRFVRPILLFLPPYCEHCALEAGYTFLHSSFCLR